MGFPYHPYIDSIIILSNNNIILFGFKMGMSSAIIYNDYKSFIFPTLFYYNVSLYSTILLLSSGRSFEDNEFTYAIFRTRFIPPDKNTIGIWKMFVCLMEKRSSHSLVFNQLIHPYIFSSYTCTCIYPAQHPSIHFIHPSIYSSIHPSIHSSIRPFTVHTSNT